MKRNIRIKLRSSGAVIAEGPLGWGVTPFEGNFYVRKKHLPFIWFRVAIPRSHPEISYEEY